MDVDLMLDCGADRDGGARMRPREWYCEYCVRVIERPFP